MDAKKQAQQMKEKSYVLKYVSSDVLESRIAELEFNPNQHRDPKGTETGGQWTDEGSNKKWEGNPIGGKTWKELAMPEKSAGDYVNEVDGKLEPITEGSEKQIKYANDLRDEFVSRIANRNTIANVRGARLHMERGEDMKDMDISILAQDAFDRNTLRIINSPNAKIVIDRLKPDLQVQMKFSDLLGKYKDIIRYPFIYQYDDKKGWIRISYDVKLRNTRSPENNPQWKFKP